MKGLVIALEGQDGTGKSTVIDAITGYFDEMGLDYINAREPGSTDIGEKIRDILADKANKDMDYHTEALLFAASRSELYDKVIKPNVRKGTSVILDRFLLSSLAYQGVVRGLGVDEVMKINDFFLDGFRPDLTILMDLDAKESYERLKKLGELDRIESLGEDFQERVHLAYLKLYEEKQMKLIKLDGTKDRASLAHEALEEVKKLMKEC
ncbi:MAG: dTMP kinase [Eubacteriales bacterium]|uniref:dTMP kinase n=1 Tax=Fenollaria sp. TaxID=1965292 RepID=UPI002A752FE8|nr:dTMP kinase [Fenollaria sp.]MDD7339474.1 dTMP kinase [Eubacteriales bacterium]MDY3105307.1 dTMP kinase [Fenollaria sp.]